MLKPQLNFNKSLDHLPYMAKMYEPYSHNWNISKGAKVGKANGLSVWLDAETFDYTYHVNAGEGFKLAIMHHLDQPIMSIRELVSSSVHNARARKFKKSPVKKTREIK